jgi:hypothetical protein
MGLASFLANSAASSAADAVFGSSGSCALIITGKRNRTQKKALRVNFFMNYIMLILEKGNRSLFLIRKKRSL